MCEKMIHCDDCRVGYLPETDEPDSNTGLWLCGYCSAIWDDLERERSE
jgi:hypothetical protein